MPPRRRHARSSTTYEKRSPEGVPRVTGGDRSRSPVSSREPKHPHSPRLHPAHTAREIRSPEDRAVRQDDDRHFLHVLLVVHSWEQRDGPDQLHSPSQRRSRVLVPQRLARLGSATLRWRGRSEDGLRSGVPAAAIQAQWQGLRT